MDNTSTIKRIYKILKDISPERSLDDIIDGELHIVKKGRRPHYKKLIKSVINAIIKDGDFEIKCNKILETDTHGNDKN